MWGRRWLGRGRGSKGHDNMTIQNRLQFVVNGGMGLGEGGLILGEPRHRFLQSFGGGELHIVVRHGWQVGPLGRWFYSTAKDIKIRKFFSAFTH